MGAQWTYLKKPIVKKDLCDGRVPGHARFGACSMQGWRRGMEDAHLAIPDLTGDGRMSLFGVFDGHGGCAVARFAAKHLPELLVATEQFAKADYQGALVASFLALDDQLLTVAGRAELRELESLEPGSAGRVPLMVPRTLWNEIGRKKTPLAQLKSLRFDENPDSTDEQVLVDPGSLKDVTPETQGCTAVVALIVWGGGNEMEASSARLFVANAGDSRCILSHRKDGDEIEALAMSEDHKPELPSEASRIKAGGGVVHNGPSGCRVQGDLNLSRSLGDFRHKQSKELPPERQIITACPEVRECSLGLDARMLILGCDGIWETNHNQKLVEKLRERARGTTDADDSKPLLSSLAAEVCDSSLCPSMTPSSNPSFDGTGCDNMTILIIEFDREKEDGKQSPETASSEAFPISSAVAEVLEVVSQLHRADEVTSHSEHEDQSAITESVAPETDVPIPQPEACEAEEHRAEACETAVCGDAPSETAENVDAAIMGSESAEVCATVATSEHRVAGSSTEGAVCDDSRDASSVHASLSEVEEEPSGKRRKLGA